MSTVNNDFTLNNEVTTPSQENNVAETRSAKDKVMEDGKLTFWELLYVARYFLPILATIGWAIGFIFNPADGTFLTILSFALIGIGFISAITVCPLKLLALPFKWAGRGFVICRSLIPVYGLADIIAAVFGVVIGALLGACVTFGLPAIFSIKKFFTEDGF